MTVQWDETGKFIVGDAHIAGNPFVIGIPDLNEPALASVPAALLMPGSSYAPGIIRSFTSTIDIGDGSEPQQYTYTIVTTWIAPAYFAGDVVQDILDLLANPPAAE